MKLKKLLAAVTAAALAVSTMAVTSFTASAADDEKIIVSTATELNLWGETSIEIGTGKPITTEDLDAYTNVSVTYTVDIADSTNWQTAQSIKLYAKAYGAGYEYAEGAANKSVNSTGKVAGADVKAMEADTEYTVKFAISDILSDLQTGLHEGDEAKTTISAITLQNLYQESGSKLTVVKTALTDKVSSEDTDDDKGDNNGEEGDNKDDNQGGEDDPAPTATKWVESPKGTFTFTGDCESEEADKVKDHVDVDLADYLADGKTVSDIESFTLASTYSGYGGGGLNGCYTDGNKNVDFNSHETPTVTVSDFDNTSFKLQMWWNDGTSTVKFTLNYKSAETEQPETPAETVEVPAVVKFYAQGNEAGGWAWADSGDLEVTIKAENDPVDINWTIANAKVNSADKLGTTGIQVAISGDDSLDFVGQKIQIEITDITIDGVEKAPVTGEYTIAKNYNETAAEVMLPYTLTFDDFGKVLTCKVKVTGTLTKKTTPVTPPSTGDDNNNDDNNNNDPEPTPAAPATASPSEANYPVVIPVGYTPATSDQIADTIGSTADGETASVNLTGNTTVEKAVLDSIAGKDITAEFKLTGGVTWEIKGTDIENAKKVDLGVRLRSKSIPAEKIAEVAGENKTVQFSLRHNGDLGFKGVLIMPFSTKYNGQYANLYYYNKAKDSLDFVGSSKISGGKASFVFTHASDYVVVIDDNAYGEDVSSAAGVFETASEASEAPYAAIVLAAAVLGAAVIVIRKRLAK